MARKPRVEYEGAIYHVMSRGDRREAIFRDDTDRKQFLRSLGEVCGRTGWRVHAYVLMSNHYHLLLETPQGNLVKGMHWFQSSYTLRFNARHGLSGHVFQGRYKAIPVEGHRDYLFPLADYIHLNPARAGMIEDEAALVAYRWSSLPGYADAAERPEWLESGCILGEMGIADEPSTGKAYVEHVERRRREAGRGSGSSDEEPDQIGWFIGSKGFGQKLLERLKKPEGKTDEPESQRPGGDYGEAVAESITVEGLKRFKLSEGELEALPKSDWRKRVIGYEIRKRTSVSLRWIKDANAFFLSRSASDFEALLKSTDPASVQESETLKRLGKEAIEPKPTAEGFTASYGEGAALRRYELCAVEKPGPSRLKATVKAVGNESGRFVLDTIDFYLLRSKRAFIAEAARLFRETAEVIEADVNRLTLAAESYILERQAGALPDTTAPVSDADRAEGMRLGRSLGLLDEIQRDLNRLGIVGETTNRLLLYLAMTSRKTEEPLAVQILSSSGAGKSHLQDAVLSLCPDEDLIKLTSLTDRALFYKGEDSLKHKAIAIAEVAGADGARYALRNLISEKKLVIESTVKNPVTGKLETQVNTVYGPTAVFETTTQPDTDPETKSRYMLLSVDESPVQTRAIMEPRSASSPTRSLKHYFPAVPPDRWEKGVSEKPSKSPTARKARRQANQRRKVASPS